MTAEILQDAQDLVVVAHPETDNYIFAAKPSLAFQEKAFRQTTSNPEERDVPAFRAHWHLDGEKGITGSSTYLVLRFDQTALRSQGLWIPGLLEAKALEAQGKLEDRVYRDYGLAVFSNTDPNKQIAQALVSQASELGLELPLVVPFRDLDYITTSDQVNISLIKTPRGIISGSNASEQISALNYKGNSGVHWLGRCDDGDWYAGWGSLVGSGAGGRVDWICGEATRENLIQAHNTLIERGYGKQIRNLQAEQEERLTKFAEALSR